MQFSDLLQETDLFFFLALTTQLESARLNVFKTEGMKHEQNRQDS